MRLRIIKEEYAWKFKFPAKNNPKLELQTNAALFNSAKKYPHKRK